ncbi:MAG: PD40 domain-containing protein [Acidobacteria bacterium]|nr:PD40 domain-containing protein [Acidobacteriota bacterium]
MKPIPHRFYEFGPFHLDTATTCLHHQQELIRLTPKVFDVLVLLVQSKGRLIERDELLDTVWFNTAVEEANLTQSISILRSKLGCGQNGQRYIETIPKRGYRFVAPVREFDYEEEMIIKQHTLTEVIIEQQEVPPTTQTATAAPTVGLTPATSTRLRTTWRAWSQSRTLLAISLIAIVLVTTLTLLRLATKERLQKTPDWRSTLRLVQIYGQKNNRRENMTSGKFSPDGNTIAFSSSGEGLNIWVIQKTANQPIQITNGTWNDSDPLWSPTGDAIAFLSDRGDQLGIWSVPSLGVGTAPTLLKTLNPHGTVPHHVPSLHRWSKDKIYYSWNNNFYSFDLLSLAVEQWTSFAADSKYSIEFSLSPDAQHLAYRKNENNQFDLYVISKGGEPPRPLTQDPALEVAMAWHPDNQRLIYTSELDGRYRLGVAYLDGRPPEQITFTDQRLAVWDVAPDGKQILCFGHKDESDIWKVNRDTGAETRLTSAIGMEFWPLLSPDAKAIAYQALQGENTVWKPKESALVISPLEALAQPSQVIANGFAAQWSPDGEKLAFLRLSARVPSLYVARTYGSEPQRIAENVLFGGATIGPPFNRFQVKDFCWSPDSSKIAYCAELDGIANLWVSTDDGTSTRSLSENTDTQLNFAAPFWSPDGRYLAYVTKTAAQPAETKQIWTLCLTDFETTTRLYQSDRVLRIMGWDATSAQVLFGAVENKGMNRAMPTEVTLHQVSVAAQRETLLATLQNTYLANIHLSPNSRTIFFVKVQEGKDDLWALSLVTKQTTRITQNQDAETYFSSVACSPDGKEFFYGKQSSWSVMTLIDNFN